MKFIRRAKVFSDCWIQDEIYGRIPQEVSILRKLDHPNIVKVGVQTAKFNQTYIQRISTSSDHGKITCNVSKQSVIHNCWKLLQQIYTDCFKT